MTTLQSKTVRLRLVQESDAEFILKLRLDARYQQFLSPVSSDVDAQKRWIRNYKAQEAEGQQFYFIIERNDGTSCGTVRVYDLKPDSFCWGSWVLSENKTRTAALESAFLVYQFGFGDLGFKKSHFDVLKGNTAVVSFHEKKGAVQGGGEEQHYHFEITKESVEMVKYKFLSKLL